MNSFFRIADGRLFNLNRVSAIVFQPGGAAQVYLRDGGETPFDVTAADAHMLRPGRLVPAGRGATAIDPKTGQPRDVVFYRVTDVAVPVFAE